MKVVMVVDDDPRIVRLLKHQLERDLDCKVYGVVDSGNAVDMAMLLSPDLIVLDVAMPGHDGGDVALQMRAHPHLSRIPIVFYSSLVTGKEAEQMKQRGCRQEYVSKTDTPWGLMSVIRSEFGRSEVGVAVPPVASLQPA